MTCWGFVLVFFNTTVQIFASVFQPELLCDWHIRTVTAYRTVHGTEREVPRSVPESRFVAPREKSRAGPEGCPSYKRGGEAVKRVGEPYLDAAVTG